MGRAPDLDARSAAVASFSTHSCASPHSSLRSQFKVCLHRLTSALPLLGITECLSLADAEAGKELVEHLFDADSAAEAAHFRSGESQVLAREVELLRRMRQK